MAQDVFLRITVSGLANGPVNKNTTVTATATLFGNKAAAIGIVPSWSISGAVSKLTPSLDGMTATIDVPLALAAQYLEITATAVVPELPPITISETTTIMIQ